MQKKFEMEWAGRKLIVETGKLAGQSHGSCTVQYGDTVVLATVVRSAGTREGIDYFPLMVDFEEKMYAAGKIKGSRFIKREGRASDEAILTARLIDRSIRPLFKETERRDVQVVLTVLSVDGENDADIPALFAAACALNISNVPWNGPVAGVRVGRINGEWVLNPSNESRGKSELEVILVGTEKDVVMIEASSSEVAEDVIFASLQFGHKHLQKLFPFLQSIKDEIGVSETKESEISEEDKQSQEILNKKMSELLAGSDLSSLFPYQGKDEFKQKIAALTTKIEQTLKGDSQVTKEMRAQGLSQLDEFISEAARKFTLEKNIRVDGRKLDEVRSLSSEVGLLPRTHGSGLFDRGETQVLSVVTLGSPGDEQLLDTMEFEGKKRYMHHYNFPSFSVGEVRPMRGPGRREIGHGALAEKALEPVLPKKEDFPYTIRVVSEVLSSNGSSSQASVCGSSLALMDAGVPISRPVAGIAIGLMTNPTNRQDYRILTDIQGIEDHAGDMDFKVAGTAQGITAVQLDIKLDGISLEVCSEALAAALKARSQILEVMASAIAEPKSELSPYAPRIESLIIDPEKIREVIGAGGKVINEIIEKTGVESIDIENDGMVMITGVDAAKVQKAVEWVQNIVKEVEVGEIYEGTVARIMDFGAFVEVLPGKDGLVHISELDWGRTEKVEDIVKIGDPMKVKVIEIDDQGRINLSRKALLEKPAGQNNNGYSQQKPYDNNQRSNNSNNRQSNSSAHR